MRLTAIVLATLLLAPAARAGGDFVDLAVAPGGVWVVGSFGLRELSPTTAGTIWAPLPTGARYPQSVAVAGGAVWVASVANGFVEGELTRIDLRTHRQRVVLRVPAGSVLYVASGAGSVYALVGAQAGDRVVRFAFAGRRTGSWRVADGGRMAADASGCWISGAHRLVHIDPTGRLTSIKGIAFGDLGVGDGAVWVGQDRTIVRVDEHTGAARTLRTGPLHLGFQHDVAVGDGALWTLDSLHQAVQRRSLQTGRVERSRRVDGIPDALAVTKGGIWVATGLTHRLVRLDLRTLRTTLATTVN